MLHRFRSAIPSSLAALLACVGVSLAPPALARQGQPAQPAAAPAAAAQPAAPEGDAPPLTDAELAQLLAPLALYPDSLLSQILMASTYPLEIVQADRWAKANKSLTGDALATELEKQPWDPSVKSLVNFPDVLSGLSDKLDWAVKVGDAFLADQKRVLDTVQSLRAKAKDAGNLKTTEQQNVTVTPATGSQSQTIVIESSKPDVVYVPTYNTTVVYGGWPYPAYPPPPPPYYPPSSAGAAAVGFGVGVACGAAWGYAWGNCNWGGSDVNINVNQNTNFNTNINRSQYQNIAGQQGAAGRWQHDPAHRQGAAYRDQTTASRYGAQSGSQRTAAANSPYRGRADGAGASAGPAASGRPGPAGAQGAGAGARDAGRPATASAGTGDGNRGGQGAGAAPLDAGGASSRAPASTGASPSRGGGGALGGGGSADQVRDASNRGNASRSGAGLSGGGGGGRGGGGGGRGGRG